MNKNKILFASVITSMTVAAAVGAVSLHGNNLIRLSASSHSASHTVIEKPFFMPGKYEKAVSDELCANQPTSYTYGELAHWYCLDCNKHFANQDCTTELNLSDFQFVNQFEPATAADVAASDGIKTVDAASMAYVDQCTTMGTKGGTPQYVRDGGKVALFFSRSNNRDTTSNVSNLVFTAPKDKCGVSHISFEYKFVDRATVTGNYQNNQSYITTYRWPSPGTKVYNNTYSTRMLPDNQWHTANFDVDEESIPQLQDFTVRLPNFSGYFLISNVQYTQTEHEVTEWTVVTQPTWTTTGLRRGTCVCGKTFEEVMPKTTITDAEIAEEIAKLKTQLEAISTTNVDADVESEMRLAKVEKFLEDYPVIAEALESDTTGCKELLAAKRHYVSAYATGETAFKFNKNHWFFNINNCIPNPDTDAKANYYSFTNDPVIGDKITINVGKDVNPYAAFISIQDCIGTAGTSNYYEQNLINDDALTMYFAVKSSAQFKLLFQSMAGFAGSDYSVTIPANQWTTVVIPRWNFLSYQVAWKSNKQSGLQFKVAPNSILSPGTVVEVSDVKFAKNPFKDYDGQIEWKNSYTQCSGNPLDITDQASFDAALTKYGMLYTGKWCNAGTNTTTYVAGTQYYACNSSFVHKQYNQYKHNINAASFFTGAQFVQNHAFLTVEDSTKNPVEYSGYEYWQPYDTPAGLSYTPFFAVFPDYDYSKVTIPVFVNKTITLQSGDKEGFRFMPKVGGATQYPGKWVGGGQTLYPGWNFLTSDYASLLTSLKNSDKDKDATVGLYVNQTVEGGTGIFVGSVMYKLAN